MAKYYPNPLVLSPWDLDFSNYNQWSLSVLKSLHKISMSGFVDGSLEPPSAYDADYESWRSRSNMVQSWIIHSLSPEVAATVSYAYSARVLWVELHQRYSKGTRYSLIRIAKVHHDLSTLNQRSQSVTAYFSAFNKLWDELEDLSPYPRCKNRRKEQVFKFLNGLDEVFEPVKNCILLYGLDDEVFESTKPLPIIDQVLAAVQQAEKNLSSLSIFVDGLAKSFPLPSSSEFQANTANIRTAKVHRDLSTLNQGSLSVAAYFSAFKKLWDELKDLLPIPICNSRLQEQVFRFLNGLTDVFEPVKYRILTDLLPTIDQALSMVERDERQRNSGSFSILDHLERSLPFPSSSESQCTCCYDKSTNVCNLCNHISCGCGIMSSSSISDPHARSFISERPVDCGIGGDTSFSREKGPPLGQQLLGPNVQIANSRTRHDPFTALNQQVSDTNFKLAKPRTWQVNYIQDESSTRGISSARPQQFFGMLQSSTSSPQANNVVTTVEEYPFYRIHRQTPGRLQDGLHGLDAHPPESSVICSTARVSLESNCDI